MEIKKAATKFFKEKNYEILKATKKYFVMKKNDNLIFCTIKEIDIKNDFEDDKFDRKWFERIATKFLIKNPDCVDLYFRIDSLQIKRIANNRNFIRHHIRIA